MRNQRKRQSDRIYREKHREERNTYCKQYRQEHLEQERARIRKYKQDHAMEIRQSKKEYKIFKAKRYGLTREDCLGIIRSQHGLCPICKQTLHQFPCRVVHIDHDHVTGKVRGILCATCNLLLGMAHDDILTMQSAIRYLEYHGEKQYAG